MCLKKMAVWCTVLNLRWPHSVWSDPSSLFMWTNALCRTDLALRHSLDVFTCSFLASFWPLSRVHLAEDTWAWYGYLNHPSFRPLFCAKVTVNEGKINLLWFRSFFYEGITWMFGLKSAKFSWHLFVLIFLCSKDQWHYPFVRWLLVSQRLFDIVRMKIVTGLI